MTGQIVLRSKNDERANQWKDSGRQVSAGFHLTWWSLSGELRLETEDGKSDRVRVQCCFPWFDPQSYLSLRNEDNKELALIEKLEDLPKASREALQAALKESSFYFHIEDLLELDEDYELRTWKVQTRQGLRRFQTSLTQWPRRTPGGAYLIQDLHGDLFLLENPDQLSKKGRALFAPFVD